MTTSGPQKNHVIDRADFPKGLVLCTYNGFQFPKILLEGVINSHNNFKALDSDIILASLPKAGTTWLKALVFSIVNRHMYDQSPLLVSNPHDLVPSLEFHVYMAHVDPDLHLIPSPQIFATHAPHRLLPNSIPLSGCKTIYVCRNPLDQFVSYGHYQRNNGLESEEEPASLEEAFDAYCDGAHPYGPFWGHVAEYYEASVRDPQRVMFLGYEDLSEDVVSSVEKVAEFVGLPFSEEERGRGVMEEIARVCSIEHLKGLEVNSKEAGNKQLGVVENCSFFRKGKIGDWKNHLTESMGKKVQSILEDKLSGSGLAFDIERGSYYVKKT